MSTNIVVRVLPSLFSIPSVVYLVNDYRQCPVAIDNESTMGFMFRRLFPGSPMYKHTYDNNTNLSRGQFHNLITFEAKHPLARVFMRPFVYGDRLPYPTLTIE